MNLKLIIHKCHYKYNTDFFKKLSIVFCKSKKSKKREIKKKEIEEEKKDKKRRKKKRVHETKIYVRLMKLNRFYGTPHQNNHSRINLHYFPPPSFSTISNI